MTQFSFIFKIFFTFIFLSWFYLLVSSAAGAESVPFPKEPIATSTHRMDDKLNERFGGGIGGSGSGNNGDRDNYVLAFINFTYSALDGEEIRRSEEKARYGEGRILNVQGHLVHVTREHNISDHTACTENIRGTLNKPLPPRGEPWIALVRRGSCTFEKKIRHVWLQGAAGVIVYNDEASVTLEKMKIIEKDRNITAVFTFRWIGEEMARVADSNQKVWVSISEGSRTYRPTNINKTSVLFVSISFIILMVISLVWLIFYYIQRFRYLQSKDQNERNLCSAAKRIIMKIPTKSGKTDEKETDTDCCAICIENYKSTDCIRVLPCRHEFHKNCIDPWLLEHRTCPMCKLDILKHYGFVVGDPIIVSLPPESPSASPLVPLNATTATTTSAIQLSPSARNNTTSVAIVTRPNFDPSQLEEIIEPSSLITPALNNCNNSSSSNSFNCNQSASICSSSTILPAIAAATSSSTSLTTTLSANSNNSNCSNARNTDSLLERNPQQQQQQPQHQHLLLKQNNNDILLSGNNSKINAKNIANNSNNSYSNLSNNSNIINNSNNYKLNRNNSLNRNNNNLQQYNNRQNSQHTQIHNQNIQHHNHNHHHHSHPHQHQHSHSLSSIIVTTTNDDINQQNINSNSNISNSNNYQLPRISTSANHILQNFSTSTNSTTPTSSRQIIGSEESFLDLDLDAELGRSRLSRHRNSDQNVSTNTSDREQAFNRASLRSTTSGSDNTHLLQVPNSRRRVRSSSLQLLSPFNKRHENRKSLQTANNLTPDDIRNFDMDLNNARTKPVHHKRLRSRSADTCRDRKSTGFLDYYKFTNEASTSNATATSSGGTSKTKQFLENIQMQSSAAFGNSGAIIKSSPLRRHSSDLSISREITTPCNITIRIISDDDSISDCDDKNLDIDDSTSHL